MILITREYKVTLKELLHIKQQNNSFFKKNSTADDLNRDLNLFTF